MGQSIELVGGPMCYKRIQHGFEDLESMFANNRGAEVKAMLKLCNSFDENNDLDDWTLFYEISELFANLVQTHSDGKIQKACSRIMEGSTDVIGVAKYILDKFGSAKCTDMSYRSYLNLFKDSSFRRNTMRPWIYQTCNEYGWFHTSTSPNQPFGKKYPLTFFTTLCGDAYGEQFTNEFIHKQTEGTNVEFGDLKSQVENVYMTYGQLDPWRAAAIKPVLYPVGSISSTYTPELVISKQKIAEMVRQWLAESINANTRCKYFYLKKT